MRTIAVVVAALIAMPLWADEPKKEEWTKIALNKGQFEIAFPEKPTAKDDSAGKQYIVTLMGGKAVLLATVNPFPSKVDPSNKEVAKSVFANAVGGLEKSLKGKVLSDKESTFAGKYPTRELDLEVSSIGIYRTKWILTEEGFVQLVAAGPKDFVNGADAKKFFKSLKMKK